jgi:hypothetical protein
MEGKAIYIPLSRSGLARTGADHRWTQSSYQALQRCSARKRGTGTLAEQKTVRKAERFGFWTSDLEAGLEAEAMRVEVVKTEYGRKTEASVRRT